MTGSEKAYYCGFASFSDYLEALGYDTPDIPVGALETDKDRARYAGFVSADGKRVSVEDWRRAVQST